ncbi:MAG: hypothetical protein PHE83_13235 [Opitutaceae bacterium]|nr:hypothetical protein [Opitutaceae bacterium]
MPASRPSSQPWPLRWIVLAIVLFILGYTVLRLHYGKRGRSFEPYHDLGERATTERLLRLGYQRIPVEIERLADPLPPARFAPAIGEVVNALGGLPEELGGALAFKPALPASITAVTAPREAAPSGTYVLQFTCAQSDYRSQIRGVLLYRKDRQLFLLPDYEKMSGQLLARSKESVVRASFPTQSLKPGRYAVTLCGARTSRSWSLIVK